MWRCECGSPFFLCLVSSLAVYATLSSSRLGRICFWRWRAYFWCWLYFSAGIPLPFLPPSLPPQSCYTACRCFLPVFRFVLLMFTPRRTAIFRASLPLMCLVTISCCLCFAFNVVLNVETVFIFFPPSRLYPCAVHGVLPNE